MNRITGKRRVLVLVVALGVAALGMFSAGRVAADSAGDQPDQTPRDHGDQGPPTPGDVWKDLSPTEKANTFPPEQRPGMEAHFDAVAADRVPVGDSKGEVAGYITAAALGDGAAPESEADLHPVLDDVGNVVAYWGGPHGVIAKDLIDAPGEADLEQILADRGIIFCGAPEYEEECGVGGP